MRLDRSYTDLDPAPPLEGGDFYVRAAPDLLPLPRAEIHLFRVVTDVAAPSVARLRASLSPDEEDRAHRLALECDRRDFIVRRAQLRAILGRYLGIAPAEVRLAATRHGRPAIHEPILDRKLRFSVARSARLALIAVARHDDVGVDVERVRPFPDALRVARFFRTEERRALELLPPQDVEGGFFGYWTRKEAVLKSLGTGLARRLDSFTLPAVPASGPERVVIEDPRAPHLWLVPVPPPFDGYAAALGVTNAPRPIRCFARPIPDECPS